MKAYTDLEQSKTLLDILPLETADIIYNIFDKSYIRHDTPIDQYHISAWSLTALLGILPTFTIDSSDDHYFRIHCQQKFSEWHDNPIDACYEMILKLNELKMLRL